MPSMTDANYPDSVEPIVRKTAAWSWRLLVIFAALMALLWVISRLEIIVVPVLLALMLSALLVQAVDWLDRRGAPRGGAVALVLLSAFAILGGIMTFVISQFITGLPDLVNEVTRSIDKTRNWLIEGPLHLSRQQIENAGNAAIQALQNNQAKLTSGALSTAATVTEILTAALLTVFILIFFLYDGRNIWAYVTKIFPADVRDRVRAAGRAGYGSLVGYVRATFLVALVDAVGVGTGLVIMSVPLALPLASLVFLGAFIPLVGAVVSGFLAVVVALIAKGWVYALITLGVLIGVPAGLVGLRGRLGRALLGGGGPLLGLGDQLLRGGLGGGEALGLLALGLFPARREGDLELGLGLSPLRLALLQDPLRLAAHLVGLPLGGGEDLIPLALGGGLQLRDLALGAGPQLGDVALSRGPLLRHLVVGRGPQLGRLTLGGVGQLVGLAPGGRPDRVGLALGRAAQVVGLALGVRAQLGGLVLGAGPQLGRVDLAGRLDLVRFRPGRLNQLGGLLLGEPQQLLDASSETGIRGTLLLPDLAVSIGQLPLQGCGLLTVLAHLGFNLPDVLIDLMTVITPHHRRELARRGLFEEVGQLGVNVRLHMA